MKKFMARMFVILGLSTAFMFVGIRPADAVTCVFKEQINDYLAEYTCDDGSTIVAMRPITITAE